jgi:hypothetical protein
MGQLIEDIVYLTLFGLGDFLTTQGIYVDWPVCIKGTYDVGHTSSAIAKADLDDASCG